jgi:hypothetical protein
MALTDRNAATAIADSFEEVSTSSALLSCAKLEKVASGEEDDLT